MRIRRRSRAAPAQEPEVARAPARPTDEWSAVPPLVTTLPRHPRGVTAPARFRAGLATTWSTPPALEPLGHHVTVDAPVGLLSGRAVPVEAYVGAALRFAPPVAAPDAVVPEDHVVRPRLLDRVLRRPVVRDEVVPAASSARAARSADPVTRPMLPSPSQPEHRTRHDPPTDVAGEAEAGPDPALVDPALVEPARPEPAPTVAPAPGEPTHAALAVASPTDEVTPVREAEAGPANRSAAGSRPVDEPAAARPLVGARPLGAELLAAVAGSVLPAPVAALVPATTQPVAPRDAPVRHPTSAPPTPSLLSAAPRPTSHSRSATTGALPDSTRLPRHAFESTPAPMGAERHRTDPPATAPHPTEAQSTAARPPVSEQPRNRTHGYSDTAPAPPAPLPTPSEPTPPEPGLPAWWPVDGTTWSVADAPDSVPGSGPLEPWSPDELGGEPTLPGGAGMPPSASAAAAAAVAREPAHAEDLSSGTPPLRRRAAHPVDAAAHATRRVAWPLDPPHLPAPHARPVTADGTSASDQTLPPVIVSADADADADADHPLAEHRPGDDVLYRLVRDRTGHVPAASDQPSPSEAPERPVRATPALRRVRRVPQAADAATGDRVDRPGAAAEPYAHDLTLPADLPSVPAPDMTPQAAEPADDDRPSPVSTAQPADRPAVRSAAAPTAEEVAAHIRHQLLVDRERAGGLSDIW